MADIETVLLPALAAIGGAGVTAAGAYMSSRERYSQRIERLAKVRESVADNSLLRVRLELMIHHEISLATTFKLTSHIINAAIALILMGYLFLFFSITMRQQTGDPPIVDISYHTIYWSAIGIVSVGAALLSTAIGYRRRVTGETLPRSISGDEITRLVKEENRILGRGNQSPTSDN